jgi:hypothetical protein
LKKSNLGFNKKESPKQPAASLNLLHRKKNKLAKKIINLMDEIAETNREMERT